eukprot:6181768-Pleurochrysis_carterae.AAC.1
MDMSALAMWSLPFGPQLYKCANWDQTQQSVSVHLSTVARKYLVLYAYSETAIVEYMRPGA